MRRALQIAAALAAMAMSCASFAQTVGGSEIGKFPTAAPLNGNERILADQNGNTVNITPSQFGSFLGTPTNQQPLPVSIGGTGANTATAALINLLPSLVANDCLAVNSGGTGVVWTPCGTGSTVFQANGSALSSSSTVNFLNSAATTGLTLGFTNPSAGGVQLTLSGALTAAGGGTGLTGTPANGQLPIGTGTGYQLGYLTAGSNISISNPSSGNITISATIPTVPVFQVNNTALLSTTAVNFLNSAATNGLTLGFTNASAGNVQLTLAGWPSLVGGSCLSNNGASLNWSPCAIEATGTGTLSYGSGCSSGNIAPTYKYVVDGNTATVTATSAAACVLSSNSFVLGGLPSNLQPATTRYVSMIGAIGGAAFPGFCSFTNSATVTCGFFGTSSSSSGFSVGTSMTYTVN